MSSTEESKASAIDLKRKFEHEMKQLTEKLHCIAGSVSITLPFLMHSKSDVMCTFKKDPLILCNFFKRKF